jgi:hypothetical protein
MTAGSVSKTLSVLEVYIGIEESYFKTYKNDLFPF